MEETKGYEYFAPASSSPRRANGIILCVCACFSIAFGMVGCALFFAYLCSLVVVADVNTAPAYTRSLLFLSTANLLDAFPEISYPPPPPPL